MSYMSWSYTDEIRLTALWNEGHPAREIAKRLDNRVSRSAVIGKAFRMGLPKRREAGGYKISVWRGARSQPSKPRAI